MKSIIVAIDGYSSCGKSTMAKTLASEAGYIYVDTGAMYRAVALYCIQNGILTESTIDEVQLRLALPNINLQFRTNQIGKSEIYLNDMNVENQIRNLEVANAASKVSSIGFVRAELVRQQQLLGKSKGLVMDGRDIGTVVFPQAELKVFLTASPEIRAHRRYEEMKANGELVDYNDVLANVIERDERDVNRDESPLRKADDAIVIDNTNLTPSEQQALLRQFFLDKTT